MQLGMKFKTNDWVKVKTDHKKKVTIAFDIRMSSSTYIIYIMLLETERLIWRGQYFVVVVAQVFSRSKLLMCVCSREN